MTALTVGHPPFTPPTWEIFLSSTARDFKDYRREIQDVLVKKAQMVCFLSEDWTDGYDATVQKCYDKLQAAHGYLLLLGHWYGSCPPHPGERSITHMEFDWAQQRWGKADYPPMAVLQPEPGSEADEILKAAAETLLADLAVTDIWRQKHAAYLAEFHKQVTGSWRTVRFFKDKRDAREYSLVCCLKWQGKTLMAATQSTARASVTWSPPARPSEVDLGALGRKKQLDALTERLSELSLSPDVPALALLICGNEDAGQRALLAHMLQRRLLPGRPSQPGWPPLEHYDVVVLTQWVARVTGVPPEETLQTPEDLAQRLTDELKQQPLYFVLDQVNRLPGGVSAFHTQFWVPFYKRLRELRGQEKNSHRLIAVVLEYTGQALKWGDSVCGPEFAAGLPDYTRLVQLPTLGAIGANDVLFWLQEMHVPDTPAGYRLQIARNVLTNADGDADGTPMRVFRRLRDENLQFEEEA